MKPAEIISLLLPTTPDLSARIGVIKKIWEDADTKIVGRFFFVKFRNSAPTIDDLVTIAHARMVNFAIPRARINDAIAEMNTNPAVMDPWVLLTTEARDLFIKTKDETGRSGELGEVLLYMLIEWVLGAPIVACKMYLKTSLQMPVHGTDGIHLGYEGDHLVVYWGESKLHASMASALTQIGASISTQVASPEKRQNEVRIIRNNMNLDGLSADALTAIKNYFNPYKSESNKLIDCYACLAGFNSSLYTDVAGSLPHDCESIFVANFQSTIDGIYKQIHAKAKEAGINSLRLSYFLLPFPSVDDARKKFQDKLWGKP
jgi:Cap4 SAVED domain